MFQLTFLQKKSGPRQAKWKNSLTVPYRVMLETYMFLLQTYRIIQVI